MVWVAIAITVVLLSLLLLLFTLLPIRVRFYACQKGGLEYRIWIKPPLLPWFVRVPDPARRKGRNRRTIDRSEAHGQSQATAQSEAREKAQATYSDVLERVRSAITEFRRVYPAIKDGVSVLVRGIEISRLHVSGAVGTGDAYEAAMLCGAINATLGLFLSLARRHGVRFSRRPSARFSPVFNAARIEFKVEVETSFSIMGMLKSWSALQRAVRSHRNDGQTALFARKSGILGHMGSGAKD